MGFKDFITMKKSLKIRQLAMAWSGFGGGVLGYGALSYTWFPEYFGPEPTMIMGFDSLVMIGAGTVTLSLLTGGSLFYLTSKTSLLLSRRSKQYNERLLDFNRRVNFHRCSSSTSLSDDYYGEKILDLTDYRFWVRNQQEKKKELAKPKKSLFSKKN